MLYDKEFIKKLPVKKPWGHPWLVGICNSEIPSKLQMAIEEWYSKLPADQQKKFYKKLRTVDDEIFIPTFFELVAHQYCIEEGWTVEYEIPLPHNNKTPDFIVTRKDGYKFILEVATLFDNDDFRLMERQFRDVNQRISEIKTDLTIDIYHQSTPDPAANPKYLTNSVKKWLETFPENIKKRQHTFTEHGFSLKIEAYNLKDKPSSGCLRMAMSPTITPPYYEAKFRKVLDNKKSKYSSEDTGLPLVIMTNNGTGSLRADSSTASYALYGNIVLTWETGTGNNAKWERDGRGYFAPKSVKGTFVGSKPGVSAVLYCGLDGNSREHGVAFQMLLHHNPYPAVALDESIFLKLPQYVVTNMDAQSLKMRWVIDNPEHQLTLFYLDSEL